MSIRKVSIIFSHWRTFRWTPITVHFFKKYQWPFEWELLIANNSPDCPSIKAITETPLGEGVKIIEGETDFPSHGRGNELCLEHISPETTHVFFTESDAFPIQDNWANAYIKEAANFDLIGPEIPQGSGRYIHPAGSLYSIEIFKRMREWQDGIKDWLFCSDAAIELGTSDRPYHVVCHKDFFESKNPSDSLRRKVELWSRSGVMQEMRSFDSGDTFDNYMLRTGVTNWKPEEGKQFYNRIGWEAGQLAAYFAQSHGFRCLKAPTHIEWMPGMAGQQAAYSDVFGGFRHVWCGSSSFSPAIAPNVREYKMGVMNHWFNQLPSDIRSYIENLEAQSK